MVFVLRSPRAFAWLYRRTGRDAVEPEIVRRWFETGIYAAMCLGTALAILGLIIAAT